jgi:hypothetical protein
MKSLLKRYWFEFEIGRVFNFPVGIGIGCGVTAFDKEDTIKIMSDKIVISIKMPPFKKVLENVDISKLNQGNVIPNMKESIDRGIWYPLGYE